MRVAKYTWGMGAACLALLGAIGVQAQDDPRQDDPRLEARLLRDAATEVTEGDLSTAEETLRNLMSQRPTSTAGLFALERVLRSQDRIGEILPFADRFGEIEPTSSAPRLLELRVYTELDDESGLEDAAEDWLDDAGPYFEPYQEVGVAYARIFGPERALSVLERGRAELGRPSLFAIEMGDLLEDLGRMEEAVLQWGTAIGNNGSQVPSVMRRIGQIREDREVLVRPLLEQLRRPPTSGARLRAGARIALEAGVLDEARILAGMALEDLEDRTRRGFLTALARQAQDVSAPGVELWAYEALRDGAANDAEVRALDERISVSALAVGDTARALQAQQAIADDLPRESIDRRRALAEVLRLRIERGAPGMRTSLADFAAEFPDAPQLDDLAVTLAVRLDENGDRDGAQSLLADVTGPKSALERGYLYLAAGDMTESRRALQEALSGVSSDVATDVIVLLDLLDRLEGTALTAFTQSAVLAHHGHSEGALSELEAAIDAVSEEERPRLLAMGARMAEGGLMPERAAEFRVRIVRDHAYSTEVPEATLELARFRGKTPEGVAEAVRLLEDLILSQPNSAIVPTARRELQRIQGEDQ